MFDLPTKKLDDMTRRPKADYAKLQNVADQFMDSGIGVELTALLNLINGSEYGIRQYGKSREFKVSILKDDDGSKYVFFMSK